MTAIAAEPPAIRRDGQHRDQIRIVSRGPYFLAGDLLRMVREGASVVLVMDLTIRLDRDADVVHRQRERFSLSYDLWEEKFSIIRLGNPPRSVSHLAAPAAEAWCLDQFLVPAKALPPDRPFRLRIDVTEEAPESPPNSSLTIEGLIDILSRRTREARYRSSQDAGPFRLSDLK